VPESSVQRALRHADTCAHADDAFDGGIRRRGAKRITADVGVNSHVGPTRARIKHVRRFVDCLVTVGVGAALAELGRSLGKVGWNFQGAFSRRKPEGGSYIIRVKLPALNKGFYIGKSAAGNAENFSGDKIIPFLNDNYLVHIIT